MTEQQMFLDILIVFAYGSELSLSGLAIPVSHPNEDRSIKLANILPFISATTYSKMLQIS